MARILKARHFPRDSFLEARLGNNPSFPWWSIIEGRELLSKGLVWRVGNGQHIDPRSHAWIPTLPNHRATELELIPHEIRNISQLILMELRRWKQAVTEQIFNPVDAEAMLALPLSHNPHNDSLFWAFESKGHFTVKSAYKVE